MVPLEQQFHEQQLKLKDQFGASRPAPPPSHRHEMAGIATKKTSPRMEMSHGDESRKPWWHLLRQRGGAAPAHRPGGMTR